MKLHLADMSGRLDHGSLFVLTPVRNCADSLLEFLDSVSLYADGVVALDDGSNDLSRTVLERHPIVRRVLYNTVRPSYRGWNDMDNRRRLLESCGDFSPDWILWLDADEIICPFDVPYLMQFIRTSARRDRVYGIEVLRMINDLRHFDLCKLWVRRLHSFCFGDQIYGEDRLHFEPVPRRLASEEMIRTRFRILHLSSMNGELRKKRFNKYREADPYCQWQEAYDNILMPPQLQFVLRPRDFKAGYTFED